MSPRRTPLLAFMFLLMAALACNIPGQGGGPTPTPTVTLPTVSIIAPLDGSTVSVGQKVDVRSVSSDTAGGVTRVDLRADGQLVSTMQSTEVPPPIVWTVQQSWTPATAGEHILEVIAYRGEVASAPARIKVTASGSVPPTAPSGAGGCTATTTTNLNFRSGPGTDYPRIYVLQSGTALPIIGRLGDNSWWQVRTGDGMVGWVSATYTDESGDCSSVPLASPPPLPPTATPTATAVAGIPPTATLTPLPQPNLQVYNIEGPAQAILPAYGGVTVTFVVTLFNASGGASGQFRVRFYPRGRADASAPPQEVAVAPLNAGAAVTVTFQHTYATAGTYVAEAEVDSAREVAESDEGDNIRLFTIQVFPPGYGT